jgi:enoyl-CoA hydratase/carnithine racemase
MAEGAAPRTVPASMGVNGYLTVEEDRGVVHAAMSHAPANVLDLGLLEALDELVDALERGRANVLVLSSRQPEFFAVGRDFGRNDPLGVDQMAAYKDALRRPLERLAGCGRPSIAAIDGRAFGAGLELAMACTLRFCSRAARLGFPDLAQGRIPIGGGTQRLPRLVGRGRALELLLTGREVHGDEGLRIGLVDRLVYRDVVEEACEEATRLARSPAAATAAIVTCVNAARDLPHESGLAVEGAALLAAFEDSEPTSGSALRDHRRPAAA